MIAGIAAEERPSILAFSLAGEGLQSDLSGTHVFGQGKGAGLHSDSLESLGQLPGSQIAEQVDLNLKTLQETIPPSVLDEVTVESMALGDDTFAYKVMLRVEPGTLTARGEEMLGATLGSLLNGPQTGLTGSLDDSGVDGMAVVVSDGASILAETYVSARIGFTQSRISRELGPIDEYESSPSFESITGVETPRSTTQLGLGGLSK